MLGLVDGHEVADEFAVGQAVERVAGLANFAVDLEAAAEGAVVESLRQLRVLPGVLDGVEAVGLIC